MSASNRYTGVAIGLHWLLALGIVVTFCVGFYMADLKLSPTRIRLFNYHKWAGVTIFALSLLRLGWRMTHQPPALPAGGPAWQDAAANWVHRAMYLLFFVVPVMGWLHSSAAGFQVVWFGVLPLPDLLSKDKALAETLGDVHGALAFTLGALVVVHVAAALKHQLVDRDQLMRRMMPGRGE